MNATRLLILLPVTVLLAAGCAGAPTGVDVGESALPPTAPAPVELVVVEESFIVQPDTSVISSRTVWHAAVGDPVAAWAREVVGSVTVSDDPTLRAALPPGHREVLASGQLRIDLGDGSDVVTEWVGDAFAMTWWLQPRYEGEVREGNIVRVGEDLVALDDTGAPVVAATVSGELVETLSYVAGHPEADRLLGELLALLPASAVTMLEGQRDDLTAAAPDLRGL
ncbi:MAG: hypothetical protein ACLGIR_05455 [Actinomycetes bacterium]